MGKFGYKSRCCRGVIRRESFLRDQEKRQRREVETRRQTGKERDDDGDSVIFPQDCHV